MALQHVRRGSRTHSAATNPVQADDDDETDHEDAATTASGSLAETMDHEVIGDDAAGAGGRVNTSHGLNRSAQRCTSTPTAPRPCSGSLSDSQAACGAMPCAGPSYMDMETQPMDLPMAQERNEVKSEPSDSQDAVSFKQQPADAGIPPQIKVEPGKPS